MLADSAAVVTTWARNIAVDVVPTVAVPALALLVVFTIVAFLRGAGAVVFENPMVELIEERLLNGLDSALGRPRIAAVLPGRLVALATTDELVVPEELVVRRSFVDAIKVDAADLNLVTLPAFVTLVLAAVMLAVLRYVVLFDPGMYVLRDVLLDITLIEDEATSDVAPVEVFAASESKTSP